MRQFSIGKHYFVTTFDFHCVGIFFGGDERQNIQQLQKGLNLGHDKQATANSFAAYYRHLEHDVGDSKFSLANGIYIQCGFILNPQFKAFSKKFSSGIQHLNFAKADRSSQIINQFVEKKTNNKIHNFITPAMLKRVSFW